MALTKTNINYSGKELGVEIIRESFNTNTIHADFGARILSGANGGKSEVVWHDASIDLTVNGNEICPSFDSDYTLNQNTTTLCDYGASGRIDHDALVGTYRERFLRPGVLKERTSQDAGLFAALTAMLIEAVGEEQGSKFLTADETYGDCQDGLILQFQDDTLANPVPSAQRLTATTVTAGNVQGELAKVIKALPAKYRYKSRLQRPKIAVSFNIMDLYAESLTYQASTDSAGAMGANVDASAGLRYQGFELVPIVGLGDDEMFMTTPDNIGLVFDEQSDLTNLVVQDGMQDSSLCRRIAWRLDWRAAAFFGKGDRVVYYG
jgi:hypothetical protein